jgi:Protein of unknown function (DUF1064)
MPNKYRAIKTVVDGIRFDSKREARRWVELRLLERAGQISGLHHQIRFDLVVNGVRIGRYTADFQYRENGELVVEDVKSPATKKARDYVLRKKLMLAIHGIEIRET